MKICENCKFFVASTRNVLGGECRELPPEPSVLFPEDLIYPKVRREDTCKFFTPPNKACTGLAPAVALESIVVIGASQ